MADEKFNCYLFAQNWSWTLQNPTKNSAINIVDVPTDLKNQEELRLNWIELYCQKFINPNTVIQMPGYVIKAGRIKSEATIKVTYIEVNGVKYYVDGDSNKSWTLTDKAQILQPSSTTPYANTLTFANVESAPKRFMPSGKTKAIFDGKHKTAKCTINITGLGTNDTNGVTFRHLQRLVVDGRTYTRVFGRANISKVSTGPTDIRPSGLTDNTVWITNLSGRAKDGKDIKASSSATFKLQVTPSDSEVSGVKIESGKNESCSLSKSDVVSVKAKNKTAEAITDNVTISMKGDTSSGRVSTTFKVNFYKKPKVTFNTTELKVNIKRVADANFSVATYDVGEDTVDDLTKGAVYSASRYGLVGGKNSSSWHLSTDCVPNSSKNIPISRFLGLASDSSNYFKIANEGRQHNLAYRYFNPRVQTVNAGRNYNSDVVCKFTFYAKPTDKRQFSYDWLSDSGAVTRDEIPSVIMPGIPGAPVPGHLVYTNRSVSGGYCRAIKFSFYKKDGTLLYSEVRRTIDMPNGSSLLSGKIIDKNDELWNKLRQLLGKDYVTEMLTIRANLVFFFNDKKDVLYYGCSHTWSAKLWLVTEADLGIQRLFPIVSETAPATPMMLTDVERFGYILPSTLVNNVTSLGAKFGVLVNENDVTQTDNKVYYSSDKIVSRLVVDVGKFVADNKIYVEQCKVIPYIKLFAETSYEQTIKFSNEWQKPNAIVDTTELSMWNRPTAKKGEYATYFDVQRFQKFIDKYLPLNNNQHFSPIITEKRGDIINTDFWKTIEEKLIVYSRAMQNWASQVTNMVVIWAFPEFNHKKGEYITNNNLYQNYWDLLHMLSGYDSFATHDYLKDSGYTHNDLGEHTYDDITNKKGI